MPDRPHILIVDDDPAFYRLLERCLSAECDVTVAGEGGEALRKALDHPPDAALVDLRMPEVDGLTLLKAMRRHPRLQHVKVIVISAVNDRETVLDVLNEGADNYLLKCSFGIRQLKEKLARLFPGAFPSLEASDNVPHSGNGDSARPFAGADEASGKLSPVDELKLQEIIDSWD